MFVISRTVNGEKIFKSSKPWIFAEEYIWLMAMK